MNIFSGSIKIILGTFIILMGILALVLVLISGSVHRDLVFKNEQEMISEMIRLATNELLDDLKESSQDLGLSLQTTQTFREAFHKRDRTKLQRLLDNQFHQYFVTADIIKLEQLTVLDLEFNIVAEATEGKIFFSDDTNSICPELISMARVRSGPQRFSILSMLCNIENKPVHAVIVPIGGLKLKGYFIIATNPVHNLIPVETKLGLPIKITLPGNKSIFQSKNWPMLEKDVFLAAYNIYTYNNLPLLSIHIIHDVERLTHKLHQARLLVLLFAFSATLLIVIFCVWLISKTTLKPLKKLNTCLHNLHKDHSHIGHQLAINGTKEVRELTQGFNEMSYRLYTLYNALENRAYTDSLTNLPNRLLFHERLEEIFRLSKEKKNIFAIFLLDLNKFKQVNDTLGHQAGDQLLKEVSLRLSKTLRDSDVITRIDDNFLSNIKEDIVARLGGDEFSAIFPNINSRESAIVIAQKIISAIERPFSINGQEIHIGVSIGIALCPIHGDEIQTLIKNADTAMYHAKKNHLGYSIYSAERRN